MADVVLFSSGVADAKRLAVIADDAVPSAIPVRIEIRDAANTLNITYVLTAEDRIRLALFWEAGGGKDRGLQLKSTQPQLWVTIDDDNNSAWSNLPDANTVDILSDEILLTPAQTAAVIGWMKFNYVPA